MKKLIAVFSVLALCGAANVVMARTYSVLDSMNDLTGWSAGGGEDATNLFSIDADGHSGNSLLDTYVMNTGNWINIGKTPTTPDWSTMESLRFWVRGTGTANPIQVKIRDNGDRTFGYNVAVPASNVADWTQIEIAKADFTYFWGGSDQIFNWSNVVDLSIALSGASGSGTFGIDEIELGLPDPSGTNTTEVTVTVVNAEVSVEVTGTIAFGTVVAGQSVVSANAVSVRNAGTGNATFKLQLTDPAGWTSSIAAGANQYVLNGALASATNQITWSEADHNLTTTSIACTETRYAGDQNGVGVAANATRSLWLQFKAPTVVSSEAARTIAVTVTAVAQP